MFMHMSMLEQVQADEKLARQLTDSEQVRPLPSAIAGSRSNHRLNMPSKPKLMSLGSAHPIFFSN